MSHTGAGINTVILNGKATHITELDPMQLCEEWTKLSRKNHELRHCISSMNSGWRGAVLRFICVGLPRASRTKGAP